MITTGLASFHHTNTQLKLQELAEPICSLSLAPGKNQDMPFDILPRACCSVPFYISYKS